MCEAVCETQPVPVVRVGINDEFGKSGPALELLEIYGLTGKNIASKAKEALAIKAKA